MHKGDHMKSLEDAESDIISAINDKQEMTYNELRKFASAIEIEEETLKRALSELEKANAIASRNSGGILTYYVLQERPIFRRVIIVEDDRNINRLMALSVGRGFDITQVYDGTEAWNKIKFEKPDLVVLDLMLPGIDGLDICQSIKRDQNLKDIIVILVSAMDATSSRFKGIKYGADYYIKKPFDPAELRSLVTIFLNKKGKKFDPLIDLPNEERISDAVEKAVKETDNAYEIGKLRVEGIASFASGFGTQSGMTILRLVSQLLQDKVKDSMANAFVGFLNGNDFFIAGDKEALDKVINNVRYEFNAVLPFIYQSEGYKPMELGIDIFGAEVPNLSLVYTTIEKDFLKERRAEVLKSKEESGGKTDVGAYTYDELRHMFGSEDLDIRITRDLNGIRLSVGKGASDKRSETKKGEAA